MTKTNLLPIVEAQLRSRLSTGCRILVAVSGGPDSVVLAHLLRQLPYDTILGHVDHQIRRDSWRDAKFTRDLAVQWDLPCRVAKIQMPSRAGLRGLGLEAAARAARYKALAKMAKKSVCSAILTAHTADDQAETVLLNFLRGTGASGLAGIPPVREVAIGLPVLRPMLGISRQEILAYLRENRLSYRIDPTNHQKRFTRNRIRLETLPYLHKRFPGLSHRLVQLAAILREEEDYWNRRIDAKFKETSRKNGQIMTVDLTRLLGYHKALGRRILRRAVGPISFQDVERLLAWASAADGDRLLIPASGLRVTRKGNKLSIWRRN